MPVLHFEDLIESQTEINLVNDLPEFRQLLRSFTEPLYKGLYKGLCGTNEIFIRPFAFLTSCESGLSRDARHHRVRAPGP